MDPAFLSCVFMSRVCLRQVAYIAYPRGTGSRDGRAKLFSTSVPNILKEKPYQFPSSFCQHQDHFLHSLCADLPLLEFHSVPLSCEQLLPDHSLKFHGIFLSEPNCFLGTTEGNSHNPVIVV